MMTTNVQRTHFREPNLSPTKTARQHVVPRFYLDSFAHDGRIVGCDLETGSSFDASIKDVGVIRGFNDLDVAGRALSTEDWLADVEGAAATIIRGLATEPAAVLTLSREQENALSRFVAAQIFRVPAFRERRRRMTASFVERTKELVRSWLENTHPAREAEMLWREWEPKPDWWWLKEKGPIKDASLSVFMLGEVQGFANLIRAMPWRSGWVDSRSSLYTSDNPVAGYLPPVRPWWLGGFPRHIFLFPLSARVLLQIGHAGPAVRLRRKAARRCQDFSPWETAFARHVVTAEATRFLYGPGPYVSRECASSCLDRIGEAKLRGAILLQGFNPYPPGSVADADEREDY